MTEEQIGALVLLCFAGPLLMLLGFLVGIQKRRGLVNGVDWTRVTDPDRLLTRLGALLIAGGAGFALIGAAVLLGALPPAGVGAAVLAVGLPMAVAALLLVWPARLRQRRR